MLNDLPEQISEDVRFSVLDNSDTEHPDFFFIPLVFLESFSAPAMVLKIGEHEITMPVDWSILVGCSESDADFEVLPLTSINDRGFEAFLYNPLSNRRPEFERIDIVNFYTDVKWYFPKTKNGQLLTTPLTNDYSPVCAFFVKDISRQSEVINYSKLL